MKKTAIRISFILIATLVISSMTTAIIIAIRNSIKYPDKELKFFAYVICIGLIVLQTISALSSFLNLNATVRNNRLYSALSFFLLPVLFVLYSLLFFSEIDFLLIVELPFFTLLSAGFIWFRKQIQK